MSHGHAIHPFLPATCTGDAQTDRVGVSAGERVVWGHRRQHGGCDEMVDTLQDTGVDLLAGDGCLCGRLVALERNLST